MSISAISSSSVVAAVYTQQASQPTQAPKAQAAPTKDTVSISPQAQQLASDGDPTALESKESAAMKSSEASRGKA